MVQYKASDELQNETNIRIFQVNENRQGSLKISR